MTGEQEQGQGFPDDVAPADDDRLPPGDVNAGAVQKFHDAPGRAGHRPGISGHEAAHVHGMEAVHVLGRSDGLDDHLGADLAG